MSNVQLARRQRVGFLQQSKSSNHWNAAQTSGANFKTLNYDVGSLPNPGVSVEQFNQSASYGLHEEAEKKFVDKHSELPSLPFSAVANKALYAPHIVAAMQAVTEGATTPFAKTATSGHLGNGISFADNEGFLFTIAVENFNDAMYTQGGILKNAMLNDFMWEVNANNKGIARLANIKGTWVGSEYVEQPNDTPFAGSWVAKPSNDLAYNKSSKFTLGITTTNLTNADIPYRRFAVNLQNNVSADLRGAGGVPGAFRCSPKWTVEIDLPYFAVNNGTSATALLMKSFINGDNIAINFETGTAEQDGHLKFAIPYSVANAQPIQLDGEYFGIRLTLDMLSSAGATPMTVTMSDTVDWGF